MQQLTPTQIREYIEQADTKPLLLDVREPHEVAICAIAESTNIPLGHLPNAFGELDPEREIVLICHHGMRSYRAGLFLQQQGFTKLINLVGGIDAWAGEVDPEMARY